MEEYYFISMNTFIREATIADAGLIADISRQTFYDTFAPYNTAEDMDIFLSTQFTRDVLLMEVGVKENTFLLAFCDGEIGGYAKLREGKKPAGLNGKALLEIARIYTTQKYIGKGVGKELMKACIGIAETRKKEFIWLCVWEKNDRAIRFYEKWGFEKFGDCDFLLGNDMQCDWMMKRAVNAATS